MTHNRSLIVSKGEGKQVKQIKSNSLPDYPGLHHTEPPGLQLKHKLSVGAIVTVSVVFPTGFPLGVPTPPRMTNEIDAREVIIRTVADNGIELEGRCRYLGTCECGFSICWSL